MARAAALIAGPVLALTAATAGMAQGVAPPGGGGEIFSHPFSHFLEVFETVCLSPSGGAERQLAAARNSRWSFQPVAGNAQSLHARSVSMSVTMRAGRARCGVSGLAADAPTLDTAVAAARSRFKLGEPQYGLEGGHVEVALWGHGSPRTITLSAMPQQLRHADGSIKTGPVHVALSLSSQASGK